MTAAPDVVGHVTSAVSYLRVETDGGDGSVAWHPCAELCDDEARLLDLVRSTAAGRGTDRDDVAMSLFVQGYAFRVASLAIGGWLLDDVVVDLAPARTAVALGRDRPNVLRVDPVEVVHEGEGSLGALHANLVDGHLARMVDAAHRATRVGAALLWSNVGAACASSFGAFMAPLADRRLEVREQATAFFAAARPELRGSGRLVPVGSAWAWERQACCLWYRTESGSRCADCSLWSAEERAERYAAAVAEERAAEESAAEGEAR